MAPISVEDLYLFHRMDREIFSCLVIKLARDPAQSLLVMALWLWLETIGYPNLISRLIGIPEILIDVVANEAVACIKSLEIENNGYGGTLPLTTAIMGREISFQLFSQKKFTAIAGIKRILNKTCARIFYDILQNILCRTSTSTSRPLTVPGFPHPLFGTFSTPPINFVEHDLSDPRIWDDHRRASEDDFEDCDKTMFLTFSKGFPVTEEEVRQVFTNTYGDCIKDLQMGNGDTVEQVLFATMVVKKVEVVDLILNGKPIAKLRANGKHIWARKYECRD